MTHLFLYLGTQREWVDNSAEAWWPEPEEIPRAACRSAVQRFTKQSDVCLKGAEFPSLKNDSSEGFH